MTKDEKKIAIAEFILSEQDILKAKTCGDLLKNQLLDAVEDKYLRELWDRCSEYNDRTVLELLDLLFANYAKLDNPVINRNMERFNEPRSWTQWHLGPAWERKPIVQRRRYKSPT